MTNQEILPQEIIDQIIWANGSVPKYVVWENKFDQNGNRLNGSRVTGWSRAWKLKSFRRDQKNLWCRCHTENYWGWFISDTLLQKQQTSML